MHFRGQFEFLNLGPQTGYPAAVCVAFLILSKQIQSQCHDSFLAHPSQFTIRFISSCGIRVQRSDIPSIHVPTTWQVSASDNLSSNIPAVGTRFNK